LRIFRHNDARISAVEGSGSAMRKLPT